MATTLSELSERVRTLEALQRTPPTAAHLSNTEMVSLKDYISVQMEAIKQNLQTQISNIEKSTTIATAANERRLEGLNEIRGSLKDQQATFVTREAVDAKLESLSADITTYRAGVTRELESLRIVNAEVRGKASQSAVMIGYAFSGVAAMLGVASLIITLVSKIGGG